MNLRNVPGEKFIDKRLSIDRLLNFMDSSSLFRLYSFNRPLTSTRVHRSMHVCVVCSVYTRIRRYLFDVAVDTFIVNWECCAVLCSEPVAAGFTYEPLMTSYFHENWIDKCVQVRIHCCFLFSSIDISIYFQSCHYHFCSKSSIW